MERSRRLYAAWLQSGVAAALAIVAIGVAAQVASRESEPPLPAVTRYPTQAELDRELAILEELPVRRTASTGSTPL